MLETSLQLKCDYEEYIRYLKSYNFSFVQNQTVHIVLSLPLSGFGLYAPQIIICKIENIADGKIMLKLSARPTAPTICVIALIGALNILFAIFALIEKCNIYFLLVTTVFTILLATSTFWQTKACLARFVDRIRLKF